MKRGIILGTLVAVGALSMGVAAWQGRGRGQQPITVDKVKENLYVLRGGGGNTAVFVTSNGVVVVDAKNPGWGSRILESIKELTPQPVTTLINTHTHGDHVGGNADFPASVDVIVQDNTRANMAKMESFAENAQGMPDRTFTDRLTLGTGADQVDLYYFGPAHTNGDAWVVFPSLRTAHAGDMFAGKGMPLVDGNNGGSMLQYPDSLQKVHTGISDVDTIINGHSQTTTTWDDLRVFMEFNRDFVTWGQEQLRAGKSPAEAAAEWKLPAKYESAGYSANVSNLFGGLEGRLRLLQEEMRRDQRP